ncbi:hypothetical protein GALLN_00494 [Gallionellaceae bacterium]|nr:hypothetical protein GALLN_00494 [Gallionellaceae bacterium]
MNWDWLLLPTIGAGRMSHPGLPPGWVMLVLAAMSCMVAWAIWIPVRAGQLRSSRSLVHLPVIGPAVRKMLSLPWLVLALRIAVAAIFLLTIYAGLFGTPLPERNLATMLTWTIWWSGLIGAIFFVGSAWCAICPWNALATWLVRRRLWRRGSETSSLGLRVPKVLRSVWPALILFVGLSWFELGYGVTVSPYATALLALLLVVLATISLAVFERRAFCRYFCPVGRTIGFYAELSPVALRPVDPDVCARCTTLECYHGTAEVEPCPTHQVMGSMKQNTYCISCDACSRSCPHQNVAWRLRSVGQEIIQAAHPRWDEAWFILGLLALTSFHGTTMLPVWEHWMSVLAQRIGDSGQLLWSFSITMGVSLLVPVALFALLALLTQRLMAKQPEYRRVFSALALATLPLAFVYHLSHNLSHLVRESRGMTEVMLNPLGINAQPLTCNQAEARHMLTALQQDTIFALQAGLLLFGFWMAVRILRHRVTSIAPQGQAAAGWHILPMLSFIVAITLYNLWLLMQPMTMRM